VLGAARDHGAAVPACRLDRPSNSPTVKLSTRVMGTLPRHTLWAVQTPQIGRRVDLLRAFDECPVPLDEITDDAQMLELERA